MAGTRTGMGAWQRRVPRLGRTCWPHFTLPRLSSSLYGTEGLGREYEADGRPHCALQVSRYDPGMVTNWRPEDRQEGRQTLPVPSWSSGLSPAGPVWVRGPRVLPSKPGVPWEQHGARRRPESGLVWLLTDVFVHPHGSATRGANPRPWAHGPGAGAGPQVSKCRWRLFFLTSDSVQPNNPRWTVRKTSILASNRLLMTNNTGAGNYLPLSNTGCWVRCDKVRDWHGHIYTTKRKTDS